MSENDPTFVTEDTLIDLGGGLVLLNKQGRHEWDLPLG
jgi:hypothetical protein